MPRECPYCGEPLRGRGDFCTACGEDLGADRYDSGSAEADIPDFLTEDADEETYRAAGLEGPRPAGSVKRAMIAAVAAALALAMLLWSLGAL